MGNLPVKLLRNIQRKDGRNEIKTYPYHRYDISCPFLHRPLFWDTDFRRRRRQFQQLFACLFRHEPVSRCPQTSADGRKIRQRKRYLGESGGTATDVMQSSESLGLPPNSLSTEESIKQGCKYFASLLSSCKAKGMNDINVVIQSYNYGGGYADYVAKNGKKHSFNLAENFAKNKSGGTKVTYTNPIAVSKNGGWRYNYGNMFYVELVNQYLTVKQFSNETVQAVMNEALKYQGWKYVYGGSNPNTSFDCSGLTQWCYGKAGISLPRTAQAQYDAIQHIPLSQAQAGDLVFFHSTYNTSDYVTHVGIYVGNNQMYHAGNPIGYTDLTSAYWQQHIICAGRIKQ